MGGSAGAEGVCVIACRLERTHGGCGLEDEGELESCYGRFVEMYEKGSRVLSPVYQVLSHGSDRTIRRGGVSIDHYGRSGSMAVLVLLKLET